MSSIEESRMLSWFSARAAARGDPADFKNMADIATPWLVEPDRKAFNGPVPDVGLDLSSLADGDRGQAAMMIQTLRELQKEKKAIINE